MPRTCSTQFRPFRGGFSAIAAGAVVVSVIVLTHAIRAADPAATSIDRSKIPAAAARQIDFDKDVKPLLEARCFQCHGAEKHKGGLRLDGRKTALRGGDMGAVIVPGKGVDSPLIQFVSGADPQTKMPAEGPPLTTEQVAVLRAWIDQGANWPGPVEVEETHWAYRTLTKPAVPAVKNAGWVRTPIDAFVLAKLEEKGMSPSPAADKRALLRRVYFDLTGLPPTPQDLAAFEADQSPNAYEKVVDQLLASPRYGERWARHWMDVVHFAETHGNDQDRERKNAWPYRDYLIRAFNEDRPYGRFIEEQLAGDVLYPGDAQATIALGFIAAGPWDESSQQSIQDGTLDKLIAKNLDRDDMLMTTMQTFASTTVHCARCHTHKFDPVTIQDYYNLQSCFAGMDRANRAFDADPQVARARAALLQKKKDLAGPKEAIAGMLLSPTAQAEVAEFEQSLGGRANLWIALDPATFVSANGALPAKQPDLSILWGGPTPETDTYTIVLPTDLKKITGIRLEVLADDALPHKGPGRQPDNGNLHLSEVKLTASPMTGDAPPRPLPISAAAADFDQDAWTSAHSIDANPATAWGIHPAEGKPHSIAFKLKEPLDGFAGGTKLTVVLEQLHGRKHVIGRTRISASTAENPLTLTPTSPDLTALLAVPPPERTEAQRAELALQVLKIRTDEKLSVLPAQSMVYAGTTDFPTDGSFVAAKGPRPIFVLKRGDVSQPMESASPAALSCIEGLDAKFNLPNPNDEGARRAALAKWISDPTNSLTWRSIVNRVWHYHFGRGIVDTPNDFGKMGGLPSHPELLDWLTSTFLETGGSIKKLHRLIVTSSVYQESSKHNADYAKVDGENRLLWRANRTRLDAESIRDAVLVVTNKIDLTMGGPSVKQFAESPGIHVTESIDYNIVDFDKPEMHRRSVYRFVFRTLPDPFMDTMDCADPSQLTPVRSTSVSALQALSMWNNRFIVRYSEHLAERVQQMKPNDIPGQVESAYRLALLRSPSAQESLELTEYAKKYGMQNVCRLIFNGNEFMFVN